MPKPMPPATAPSSVQVASEAASDCERPEIGADRGQHEAEDQEVEPVHGIAGGRAMRALRA
jgi:hypothetical protein